MNADSKPIVLAYSYRLLPTKKQHAALADILESQRILYNAALQERIGCYQRTGKTIGYAGQCKSLTELRKLPEYSGLPLSIQRWTLKRIDEAYAGFFRRIKANEKCGFPRYRGQRRWRSFGFREMDGLRMAANRLRFKGMPGSLRIHLHRPLPDSKPLSCTITRDAKGWSATLQYRLPIQSLAATGRQVGIDLGLTTLAMLSTGEAIRNPRTAKRAEKEMRRRRRALARCKQGSKRRRKIKRLVTRLHARIGNARSTYLHQVSARIVRDNDLIAVENLNVKGLARTMLGKSVQDVGWTKLKEFLAYKAAKAGRRMIEVDCRGTSQTCPECGQVAKKELKQRTHSCDCGCVLNRDHAAAIVILQRAVALPLVSQRKAVAYA